MKKLLFAVALIFPVLAIAGAKPSNITTAALGASSPSRYKELCRASYAVSNNGTTQYVWPYGRARLVDIVIHQQGAGTVGTSWSVQVRKILGTYTTMLSTTSTALQSSGATAATVIDAKGDMALPVGWTRPVIKTDGSEIVAKGDYLDVLTTESGSYSVHPTAMVCIVFESFQ